jgi:hypothetical protein
MKARLPLLLCVAGLLAAPAAFAAPVPTDKNAGGPVISMQVKPIDTLLGTVKEALKNFMPEKMYKEFEKEALSKLDTNQIKGIDTTKPLGLYATLGPGLLEGDVSKSTIVGLIPVTSENDFVALLAKIDLKAEKKDGYYTIAIPNAPVEGTLRFFKGYAYIGIDPNKLDPKTLIDPKEVISDKETSAIALRVRIDRLPKDVKEAALDFLAKAGEMINQIDVPGPGKEIVQEFLKAGVGWLKMGLEEGKELALKLDIDPKAGTLVIETSLEAKSATALAKIFGNLKPTRNDFAGIIGADSAGHILIQTPLFVEDFQKLLDKLLDWGIKEADGGLGDAPKEVKDLINEALKTLQRTVKSGTLDLAVSLRGPNKDDQYTAIGAISLKDTAALEKLAKAALKIAPPKDAAKFKVDSFKIGDVNVHEVLIGDDLPMPVQNIFGKSSVMIALAPNAGFVAFGPDGKKLLTEALTTKLGPKPAPLIHAEVSGKRLLPLLKAAGAPVDGEMKELFDKLGKLERISVFSLKVESGNDKLVIKTEIGAVPIMAAMYFGVSARQDFRPVPPKVAPAIEKR